MKPDLDLVLFDFAQEFESNPGQAVVNLYHLLWDGPTCRGRADLLRVLAEKGPECPAPPTASTERDLFEDVTDFLYDVGGGRGWFVQDLTPEQVERMMCLACDPDALLVAHGRLTSPEPPEHTIRRLARQIVKKRRPSLLDDRRRFDREILDVLAADSSVGDRVANEMKQIADEISGDFVFSGPGSIPAPRELCVGIAEAVLLALEGYAKAAQPTAAHVSEAMIKASASFARVESTSEVNKPLDFRSVMDLSAGYTLNAGSTILGPSPQEAFCAKVKKLRDFQERNPPGKSEPFLLWRFTGRNPRIISQLLDMDERDVKRLIRHIWRELQPEPSASLTAAVAPPTGQASSALDTPECQ